MITLTAALLTIQGWLRNAEVFGFDASFAKQSTSKTIPGICYILDILSRIFWGEITDEFDVRGMKVRYKSCIINTA